MNYVEFAHSLPLLEREMIDYNKGRILEIFKPSWNKYSNSLCYLKNGRQNSLGFTLMQAFNLMNQGKLKIKGK
jgi:hypothetical protein